HDEGKGMRATSLRARLFTLIIAPLLLIACGLGLWRYMAALETAEELFDRALFSAGLAIARDVAVTGGDALSITTRDQLRQAAGGEVYYHVAGPDLSYVTGYAYPPAPREATSASEQPLYFYANHQAEPVRAVRIAYADASLQDGGPSLVTVWQRGAERQTFAQALATETALSLAILVAAVAVIVWFGVDRGLRPLKELEEAISARSSDDLTGIRRAVPREVEGVVRTLNSLFDQVRGALAGRDAFISDAAHQLRNPAASLLTLAEAAERAPEASKERLTDLRVAAERLARLTEQLLSLERLDRAALSAGFKQFDLAERARSTTSAAAPGVLEEGHEIEFSADSAALVHGDEVLVGEALTNLIDNALRHGPPDLSRIDVSVVVDGDHAELIVADDGAGLAPEDTATAFSRFGQIGASKGSGLGLAITARIAELHGAEALIDPVSKGARIRLRFPITPKEFAHT
ncbi:MAG: sensor histidine kinase, partial [Pseudomonadota bacterium]